MNRQCTFLKDWEDWKDKFSLKNMLGRSELFRQVTENIEPVGMWRRTFDDGTFVMTSDGKPRPVENLALYEVELPNKLYLSYVSFHDVGWEEFWHLSHFQNFEGKKTKCKKRNREYI